MSSRWLDYNVRSCLKHNKTIQGPNSFAQLGLNKASENGENQYGECRCYVRSALAVFNTLGVYCCFSVQLPWKGLNRSWIKAQKCEALSLNSSFERSQLTGRDRKKPGTAQDLSNTAGVSLTPSLPEQVTVSWWHLWTGEANRLAVSCRQLWGVRLCDLE